MRYSNISGKVVNCGQTCIAPDYILVHKQVAKEFVAALKKSVAFLFGEDTSTSPLYSRISCRKHFDRIKGMLDAQLQVKGTVLEYGGRSDADSLYIEPTILSGLRLDAISNPILKDEIFGPLLPVIEVESIDEAIKYINSKQHPLSIYPQSTNQDVIEKIFQKVKCGNAVSNDTMVNFAGIIYFI